MKTLAILILVLLTSATASAQTTTPPSSWTGFTYGQVEFGSTQDADLSRLRVRINKTPSKNACDGGRVEVDLADSQRSYFHEARLSCNMGGWTVKAGRLFSAALTQSPPPFMLKTAKYSNSWTYTAYAYGVQVDRTLGKGWQASVDFTGHSGLKYDDVDHLFNRFESSGRVTRRGGAWSYGGAYQASRDFLRVGLDGERQWGKLTTNALLSYSTERKHVEGFTLVEYRLVEWVRPHIQIERAKNRTSMLTGVGVYVKKYVYFVAEHDGHNFYARLQLMISKK